MTDVSAALGLVQLKALEERWQRRRQRWNEYDNALSDLPLDVPPKAGPGIRHGLHVYSPQLRLEELTVSRDTVAAAMQAENIGVGIHFPPVHVQPYYRKRFGYRPSDLPNARRVGHRTISLPLSAALDGQDVADVCEAFRRILRYYSR
jgi:dTDP-4-amino-4,6-dideoxygalactose transaminase